MWVWVLLIGVGAINALVLQCAINACRMSMKTMAPLGRRPSEERVL